MSFEDFCNINLGDAVVRENEIPISKKIRNYETFWLMSPFFMNIDDFDVLLSTIDDTYQTTSIVDGEEVTTEFSIDRSKAYRLITEHRNPHIFKI